jgi:catechol 2,3-dioxygenase-like lactoylglutathione lyase family enzyme
VNWKLEVVVVPVSDVDRAKAFYTDGAGFELDHDVSPGGEMRIVQLTPPGSACSIVIGEGVGAMQPGSLQGLHLVVPDIAAARSELIERGVAVSEVQQWGRPTGMPRNSPTSATPTATAGSCRKSVPATSGLLVPHEEITTCA